MKVIKMNNRSSSIFVVLICFSILFSCNKNTKNKNTKRTSSPSETICTGELLTNAPFAAGSGTDEDPYFICTPTQLNKVKDFLSSSFKLQSDIDLIDFSSGTGWQPIGTYTGTLGECCTEMFSGKFDGNDKTITNLSINRPTEDGVGLFGVLADGAEISNVKVNGSVVGRDHVGGVVGSSNTTLATVTSRVSFTGSVSGFAHVGGVYGYLYGGTLKKSWADVSVTATDRGAGGLIGGGTGGIVENCYALGSVSGPRLVGGLIGSFSNDDGHDSSMTIFKNTFVRVNLIRPSGVDSDFGYFVGVIDVGAMYDLGNYYLLGVSVTGGVTPQSDHVTGLADVDFKNTGSFSGWDFDTIWNMGESYPTLK
jgi:hypothetical protein